MNRRGFLAAIPGLAFLSRLRGKKEERRTEGVIDWSGCGETALSNCDRAVIAAGCPDALNYRLRPQYVIERVWCRDETGHSRTRRIVRLETPDEVSKRLWLDELSRQWDSA